MSVIVEKVGADGGIWVVELRRPSRRNAVDRPTATALAEAFTDFENDPRAKVAVLYGADGTFCSGADLKALAQVSSHAQPSTSASNQLVPVPDLNSDHGALLDDSGPMGLSRMVSLWGYDTESLVTDSLLQLASFISM